MLVIGSLVGLHRTVQLQLLQHYWSGTDLDYCDIEWFALEKDRNHSAVTPQETDPDFPRSVQESPAEVWDGGGLLQGWGQ